MGSGEAKKFRDMYGSAGRHGQSFWEEEKDNVGMRLLKNMGWAMGQGLGKDGNGRTDHVKQFRKKDNSGIGAKAGTRDEAFKASQELFNDVLSRLSVGGGGGGAADAGESEGATLGTAAKSVRGVMARRQMTRRFCRAAPGEAAIAAVGNMAVGHMAGAASMDEIFGRKSGGASAGKDDETDAQPERPPELQQTTSSVSVSDYFAQRRAQLGLGGSASSGGSASVGFTLDDQAAFADAMQAKAYGGRRGLGLGGDNDDERTASGRSRMAAQYGMAAPPPMASQSAVAPPSSASHTANGVAASAPAERKGAAKAAKMEKKEAKAEKKAAREAAAAKAAEAAEAEEAAAKAARKAERKAQRKAARKAERKAEKKAAKAASASAVPNASVSPASSKKAEGAAAAEPAAALTKKRKRA